MNGLWEKRVDCAENETKKLEMREWAEKLKLWDMNENRKSQLGTKRGTGYKQDCITPSVQLPYWAYVFRTEQFKSFPGK